MKQHREEIQPDAASAWSRLLSQPLRLEHETALYVLVSVLDVCMTFLLLRYSANSDGPVRFIESNPIARWILAAWNIRGMVYFKFSLVALVAVIAQIIALTRPQTARRLLNFATLVVACVIIYSLTLLLRHADAL